MTREFFGNLRKVIAGWMNPDGGSPQTGIESVIFFERKVTLALADVTLIPDSEVPRGYTPYVTGFLCEVTTGYVGGTDLRISDKASSPVDFVTMAIAGLTLNAILGWHTAANVTLGNAFKRRGGGTVGKGLQARFTGVMSAGAAELTVWGYYKATKAP